MFSFRYNTNQRERTSFNPSTNNCLLLFEKRVEIIWYETSKELCINKYAFYWLNHIGLISSFSLSFTARASLLMNKKRQIYAADDYRLRERKKVKQQISSWTWRPKKWASVASLHKSNKFALALTRVENSIPKTQAVKIKMFLWTDHLLS